jgi:hypothetical protein
MTLPVHRISDAQIRCRILAQLGFAWATISRETGMSLGQIGRELRSCSIRVRDYRAGQSPASQQIISYVTKHEIRDI